MAYVDDFKLSNTAITWNGVKYYPVTNWTTSDVYNSGAQNTRAAVRFLMADTSSLDNNIIIAQYSAYTPNGVMYRATGYYLIRRLNSVPGDLSQTGAISQGTIISTPDIDIRLWPWDTTNDHTVQEGHLIWPDRPYILRSVGTLVSGESKTCMRFYIKDTDPDFRNTTPNIQTTYTAPYKIIFDSNGGTGYVETIAKHGGSTITLPTSNDFSRTNYNLLGFSTNSSAVTATYAPGATYTVSANVILYAIWQIAEHYVTFNQNKPSESIGSISNMPSQQTKQPNVALTLSSKVPKGSALQPPYTFKEWNTQADGSGSPYQPSGQYTKDVDVTLYAIWTNNYKRSKWNSAPDIYRAAKNGSVYIKDDYGEYLVVSGSVRVYDIDNYTNTPTRVTISGSDISPTPSVTTFTQTSSGTDSTGSYKVYSFEYESSAIAFNAGSAYTISLTFRDAYQTQYTAVAPLVYSKLIPVAFITFSTNGNGKSAAFGREARMYSSLDAEDKSDQTTGGPGRLDIGMNTHFTGKTYFGDDPQNPVAVDFSNSTVTGLPTAGIATTSTPGIVQPDGTTIVVNAGVISVASSTKRHGGKQLEDFDIFAMSESWTSGSTSWGWREEKFTDGRLIVSYWQIFDVSANSDWNYSWLAIDYPTSATAFIDTPIPAVSTHVKTASPYNYNDFYSVTTTSIRNSSDKTGFKFFNHLGNNNQLLIIFTLNGHWQ